MPDDLTPRPEPPLSTARPIVVLVNSGTPDAPTAAAVRTFLGEFLSDRRVVDTHPALWQPILHGIVLRSRPRRSAALYQSVWLADGSPLLVHSRAAAAALGQALSAEADVRIAMSYGRPGLAEVLDEIARDELDRPVLVVPMFPQYAGSCTGAVHDAAHRWGLRTPRHVDLRLTRSFATHPAYIDALAAALEDHWSRVGALDTAAGDRLLLSFHSIPVRHHRRGDPYRAECEATRDALLARLDVDPAGVELTFQSRFGRGEWLTPATVDTVTRLGTERTRRLDLIAPGFTADCLETVEELGHLNRAAFREAGGGDFHHIRWSNDRPAWIAALAQIVREQLRRQP